MCFAMSRRISSAIALLATVGIVVSSISLFHHYGSSKSSFCDFGNNFNCDMVNRSIYSTVFGIPVALIGILGYALLLGLATIYRSKKDASMMLLLASVAGLGFAIYLTYIEGFVLGVWCILCLSSFACILGITALSSTLVAQAMWRAADSGQR
jgi:vitamin-K-epoxide reductase (warfarin-sensitive)